MTSTARALAQDDNMLKLVRAALDQGWRVEPTNNGKILFFPKDKDQSPVPSPTRAIGRSYKNVLTALQRAGLDTTELKDSKGKFVAVEPGQEIDDEKVKEVMAFQDLVQQAASYGMGTHDMEPARAELFNAALSLVNVQMMRAVVEFGESLMKASDTGPCDHSHIEAKIVEAEKNYLDLVAESDSLRKQNEKLHEQVSRLGTELKEAAVKAAENLERANKAENRLRALRSALTED